jgi:hypothetical protein
MAESEDGVPIRTGAERSVVRERKKRRPHEPDNPTQSEIDDFLTAREKFCARYQNLSSSHPFLAGHLASRTTVQNYRRVDLEWREYSHYHRNKLIAFVNNPDPTRESLYSLLARGMRQTDGNKSDLLKLYMGKYRYFRYATAHGTAAEAEYSFGRMNLLPNDDEPRFEHWSHDAKRRDVPENDGYVFKHDSRIYFAGKRPGVMRLAIAQGFENGDPATSCLKGIVLSARMDLGDPFSARFIMVHESNKELSRELGEGKGEQRFLDYWNDDANFMLLTSRESEDMPDQDEES